MSLTVLLAANLVVFGAALVQAGAGLGFAMVAMPLLALIDLHFVPGPMLVAAMALVLLMLASDRAAIADAEVRLLLPGLAVGTPIGALLLAMVPQEALGALFALVILIGVVATVASPPFVLAPPSLVGAGFAAGVMGTVAGMHGPPLAVLYHRQAVEKTRATLALVFLIGYVIALVTLALAHQLDAVDVASGLSLIPGVVLGFVVARRVRRHLPAAALRAWMLGVATSSALVLLMRTVL